VFSGKEGIMGDAKTYESFSKNHPVKFLRDLFFPPILSYISLLMLVIFASLPVFIIFHKRGIRFSVAGEYIQMLIQVPYVQAILGIVVCTIFVFFIKIIRKRVGEDVFGTCFSSIGRGFMILSFAGGLALGGGEFFLSAEWVGNINEIEYFYSEISYKVLLWNPVMVAEQLILLAYNCVFTPFAEELYFRHLVIVWLAQRWTLFWAVAGSAALFSVLHFKLFSHPNLLGVIQTSSIAVVGIVAARLYIRSGSLWASFIFHSGYNFILSVLSISLK
jgi:membrane protease YdiL (CAAX protease family)